MRGVTTNVTEIRRKVFTEIARMSFEGGDYGETLRRLPHKIVPGEVERYRENIIVERAVVSERLRLALGLPLRQLSEYRPTADAVEESVIAEKYYTPPLVNIISFACHCCPPRQVRISNMCQGCMAHPCMEVCPKDAIHRGEKGTNVIDQDRCIKCGKCVEACPYHAIIQFERPCAAACGMDAIGIDPNGRAVIDYDRCVSCGMCIVSCPFGAISDKSQIFQMIQAIRRGDKVVAAVAPAFLTQFGERVSPAQVKEAMLAVGFHDVREVAVGADLCTLQEARDFLEEVPDRIPFMATSCCPAWSVMAKKLFPQFKDNISMALTPMVLTARLIKRDEPDARVVFVGPCAAKKLEASRRTIRSDVDFVLTFEEMQGVFDARDIRPSQMPGDPAHDFTEGTGAGRTFAVSGGVAAAVRDRIRELAPDREVPVEHADGLRECRKLLNLARLGRYNGYLLEGMGCPGGCVAGAGTIASVRRSTAAVEKYGKAAPLQHASQAGEASWLETAPESFTARPGEG